MSKVDPVVSVSWLSEQIRDTQSDSLVILDSSWDAFDHHGNHNKYISGHIPGALFFDLNNCITPRPTCARNLPDPEAFSEYARSLGICRESHLVVYDRNTITSSTKAWWTFRVFGHVRISVLDGGLMEWQGQGHDLSQGEETASQPGDFEVHMDRSLRVEYDEMLTIVRDQTAQIVDTRMEEHFKASEKEPCTIVNLGLESMDMPIPTTMHQGHMPGAVNIYKSRVLRENSFRFLSNNNLSELFSDRGIDLSKPLVTTCYMGHSASIINMAAFLCGYEKTRLYYGSWTEFGQLAPANLVQTSTDS